MYTIISSYLLKEGNGMGALTSFHRVCNEGIPVHTTARTSPSEAQMQRPLDTHTVEMHRCQLEQGKPPCLLCRKDCKGLMYIYIYIYKPFTILYICMYICICICICTYIYVYIHTYCTYIHVYVCMYMCVCMFIPPSGE